MSNERQARLLSALVVVLLFGASSLLAASLRVVAQDNGEDDRVFLPLIAHDYDATWQWTSPITLTITPQPSGNPLMTVDHQGRPHALWDTSTEPKFIYHTTLDSAGWTTTTTVAESLGTSELMYSPVVDSQGNIHLLWRNRETYEDPYRALYARFASDQWSAEEELYQSPQTGLTLRGMVHLDDSNGVHATLVESALFLSGVAHVVRSDTGWGSPVAIENPSHSGWLWPDDQGGVHFYGNDYATPPRLYYSYWRDGRFAVRDRRGPDRIKLIGRDTQLDGAGNLHVFWTGPVAIPGGNVTGLSHQCLRDDLQASSREVLSGENTASSVVKAGTRTQRFALAWREGNEGGVKLGVWAGCERTDVKGVPFSPGQDWSPKAVAVSDAASRICVLGRGSGYPQRYEVVCADILR